MIKKNMFSLKIWNILIRKYSFDQRDTFFFAYLNYLNKKLFKYYLLLIKENILLIKNYFDKKMPEYKLYIYM
jgi:hypothetical protein